MKQLIFIIFTIIIVAFFVRHEKSKSYEYYPKSSFKLPLEFEKDKVATTSATSVRLPIIMYHYVEYVADKGDTIRIGLNTTPAMFEKELQSIKNHGYETVFMKDVPDFLSGKTKMPPKTIALTFDDGYQDFHPYVLPLLKKYNLKATIYIISNFIGRHNYMSESEIKDVIASGLVEIGSHTLNHVNLRNNPDIKEITESKINLEKTFNIKVYSFAYPYGGFSKDSVEIVQKAGYTNATSVIPGVYQSQTNKFYLSRLRTGFFTGPDPIKSLERYNEKNKP